MIRSLSPIGTARPALERMPVTFRRVQLAGLTLHAATMHDALTLADQAIRQRRRLAFGMVNIAKLVNAGRDPLLQDSLLKSDVVLADGQPVVWLSRIQGEPLPERVAGIDLMYRLLELANQRGHAVFLLGATEAVNAAVAARIQQCYPACRLAGRRDGYFSEAEEAEVARQIRDSGADILFVAMSPPRKELFLRRWSDEMGIPMYSRGLRAARRSGCKGPDWSGCIGFGKNRGECGSAIWSPIQRLFRCCSRPSLHAVADSRPRIRLHSKLPLDHA